MPRSMIVLATLLAAAPATAQSFRSLGAHVHGVSVLNLAFADNQIAITLHAPGFDIVGFEYGAERDADIAAVEAALARLADPLTLFQVPDAAGCSLTLSEVALLADKDGESAHSEFEANAVVTCTDMAAIDTITMGFFEAFATAEALEVVIFTTTGAQSFEVERGRPVLDLRDVL